MISNGSGREAFYPVGRKNKGLENLTQLWRLRCSLTDSQARQFTEYLAVALAERLDTATWSKALDEALHCVTLFYPNEQEQPKKGA